MLQRRDELSEKNLRLVKSIQAGQSEMDSLRLSKKELERNNKDMKAEIETENKLR
jgi:cell division protein FtsB